LRGDVSVVIASLDAKRAGSASALDFDSFVAVAISGDIAPPVVEGWAAG